MLQRSLLVLLATSYLTVQAQDTIPDRWEETYQHAISFWENNGQCIDENGDPMPGVEFYSEGAFPSLLLHEESLFSMVLKVPNPAPSTAITMQRVDFWPTGKGAMVAEPEAYMVESHYQNFYVPHTAPTGLEFVYGYNRIVYPNIYDGIDMHFYSGSRGQKMSIVCWPGSNPYEVAFQFAGQDSIGIDVDSIAEVHIHGQSIKLKEAVAYQVDGTDQVIPLNWNAEWNQIGNDILSFNYDSYDPNLPLVIQIGPRPMLQQPRDPSAIPPCWGALFGGDDQDYVTASAVDGSGNYYVAGYTESFAGSFPSTSGSVQYGSSFQPMWLAQFNDTHELKWTIRYGGNTFTQVPNGLATKDMPGGGTEIYMAGFTYATDILTLAQAGAYNNSVGQQTSNGVIAKFNDIATMLWSTYYGTNITSINDIDVTPFGQLVVAGFSASTVPQPTVPPPGAYVQAFAGNVDGFITMFTIDDNLRWSTPIGGSQQDRLQSVRTTEDKIVVVGYSTSSDFLPIEDGGSNAYDQDTLAGTGDITVTEFDINSALLWSTYIGGAAGDYIDANDPLSIDPNGNVYVLGNCASLGMPFEPGTGWNLPATTSNYWVIEFSGTDRSLLWSSPLAAAAYRTTSIRTDAVGNVFIGGRVADNSLLTNQLPGFYFQSTSNTGATSPLLTGDGGLLNFNSAHDRLLATYVGGNDWGTVPEEISTIVCNNDFLYAAGITSFEWVPDTSYFPVFYSGGNAWADSVYAGGESDGFVMAFCKDVFTAVPEWDAVGDPSTGPYAVQQNGQWMILGWQDGSWPLEVYDVRGRLVRALSIRSYQGKSAAFSLNGLDIGIYLLHSNDPQNRAVKILME